MFSHMGSLVCVSESTYMGAGGGFGSVFFREKRIYKYIFSLRQDLTISNVKNASLLTFLHLNRMALYVSIYCIIFSIDSHNGR